MTGTHALRRRLAVSSLILACLVASGLILSIALTHDRRRGGDTRSVLHFSYVDGPDTFAQLVDTAEAVVVAEPIGKEVVLASLDGGIEIAGQPFLIVSSVKGSLLAGSQITLLRTTVSADSSAGELPFARPLYVFGVRQSATYPGWITLGGPSGRIGFGDDGTAVVDDSEIAVQQEVAGKTVDEVVALAQGAITD